MTWRLARSLEVLRTEVQALHPGTRVDTIGDQAHANRPSDHNPNSAGVVCAADFFANAGLDLAWLATYLVTTRHPALKYVIYNGRIWSTARASEGWRPYTGSNPHTTHVHVSVGVGPDGRSTGPYDNTSPWLKGETMNPADVWGWDPNKRGQGIDNPWSDADTNPTVMPRTALSHLLKVAVQEWPQLINQVAELRRAVDRISCPDAQDIADRVLAGLGGTDLREVATALRAALGNERAADLGELLVSGAGASPGGQA